MSTTLRLLRLSYGLVTWHWNASLRHMFGRGVITATTSLTATPLGKVIGTRATLVSTLPALYASFVFHCNAKENQRERMAATTQTGTHDINRPYYSWKRNLVSGEFPGGSTVTSELPRILVIDFSANVRTTLKMKDAQGNWRGRCNSSGCQCDFFLSEDTDCSACDYCGHPPTDHDIMTLGPCTSCGQCSEYVEDAGEEGKCSYCGCTPADHGRRNCVTITLYIVHARLVCSIPLFTQNCTANCQGAPNHDV